MNFLNNRGVTEVIMKGKKKVSKSLTRAKKIRKKPWVPSVPWEPHPRQVTVEQCCKYLNLRDYPVQVNQTLQERFKDKQKFDDYATPLLKITNPLIHPLILSTLIKAKWFEVMNTETGGLCYSQV